MTPLDFLVIVGAALSLHRIWNYEPICVRIKRRVKSIKPLNCPVCNPVWIGLLTVCLWLTLPLTVLAFIAAYLPVRVAVWVYERPGEVAETKTNLPVVAPPPPPMPVSTQKFDKTVVIMTALGDFRSSYSVAQEAVNVAKGIALTNPNWSVQLWTTKNCSATGLGKLPSNIYHNPIFPDVPLEEDKENPTSVAIIKETITRGLSVLQGPGAVITQDLMFISWFLSYARAIHDLPEMDNVRWWHVCHSTVGASSAGIPKARCTIPLTKHTIVTVAHNGVVPFMRYYNTSNVIHLPNARDPRTLGLSDAVQRVVAHRNLWDADVVQILPACSTRLEAKGFIRIARVFAHLNKHLDARLVVCNPNATGDRSVALLNKIKAQAREAGLADDKWCLTSEVVPETAVMGLTSRDVMDLMMFYGNVLVMASHAEADSLVLLEARLARQFIITNNDVTSMSGGSQGIAWGVPGNAGQDEMNADFAAQRILDHFSRNTVELSRKEVLRTRNLEVMGHRWGMHLSQADSY